MGMIFSPLTAIFRNHKLKLCLVLAVAVLLAAIMFPNDDLSDYVSALAAKNGGIYLQMDNLGIKLITGPGLEANDVVLEQKGDPPLKIGGLQASVSLLKALTAKIGISARIEKLFGGNFDIDYQQDGKAKSGTPFDEVTLHVESLSLEALLDYLASANVLGPKMRGSMRVDLSKLRIDHMFEEQPSATASLDIPTLSFPAQTLLTQMGPQPIPTLELGHASLKNAKLSEGQLDIPDFTLGDPKGEFYAKIKGTLGLKVRKVGAVLNPEISNINLNLKVTADKEFMNHNRDLLGGFLMLMGSCKQDTPKGVEIACNLKISALGQVPNFTPSTEKL